MVIAPSMLIFTTTMLKMFYSVKVMARLHSMQSNSSVCTATVSIPAEDNKHFILIHDTTHTMNIFHYVASTYFVYKLSIKVCTYTLCTSRQSKHVHGMLQALICVQFVNQSVYTGVRDMLQAVM